MPNNFLRNNQDDGLLGRVAAVHGVVMDIDFPPGQLPGMAMRWWSIGTISRP
jgi:hypothetical protein